MPCIALLNINGKLGEELNRLRLGFAFRGPVIFVRNTIRRLVLLAKRVLLLQSLPSLCSSEPFSFSTSSPIGDQDKDGNNILNACVSAMLSTKRSSLPFEKSKSNIMAAAASYFGLLTLMRRTRPTESILANRCRKVQPKDSCPIRRTAVPPSGSLRISPYEYRNIRIYGMVLRTHPVRYA